MPFSVAISLKILEGKQVANRPHFDIIFIRIALKRLQSGKFFSSSCLGSIARYYDPGTGRFANENPLGNGANWHMYA
jgi:hypothetical protein